MSGKFYVFKCRRCGQWGVKEIRVGLLYGMYTCRYEGCRKTSKIKKKSQYGLAMQSRGPYDKPGEAAVVCQKLNGMRVEKDVKKIDDVVLD